MLQIEIASAAAAKDRAKAAVPRIRAAKVNFPMRGPSLGIRLSGLSELHSHKVDEGAHRRCEMARLRIDEPDRLDLRLEPVKHRNELALRDSGVGEIVCHERTKRVPVESPLAVKDVDPTARPSAA